MTNIAKAGAAAGGELVRIGAETLTEAYRNLQEVRDAHATFIVSMAERTSALDAKAKYVLGSLDAARRFLVRSTAEERPDAGEAHPEAAGPESPGDEVAQDPSSTGSALANSAEVDPLAEMVEKTKAELESARVDLDGWAKEQTRYFEEAFAAAEETLVDRARAYAAHHRPSLKLQVVRVGGERCIIHVPRPADDEAVILCHLLAGRPPSRHDFLRDDSVDMVDGPVHLSVREYGIDPLVVTEAGPEAEEALVLDIGRRTLPIRAHLPIPIPGVDWPKMRLMTRGPVLELEVRREGGAYSHIVAAEECELFTGYVLSMRARGLLDVDIDVP